MPSRSYMVFSFYYNSETNRMHDQDGDVVNDIFRFISPSLYNMYKENKGTYYTKDKTDPEVMYEFVFPIEELEDEVF